MLYIAEKLALGGLFRDIIEGADFVRLDERTHPDVSPTLILDLTWSLTDEQARLIRRILERPNGTA